MHSSEPASDCNLRCADHRPYLRVADRQGDGPSVLVQCNRCRLVFEEPRPPATRIAEFYASTDLWLRSSDADGKARSYVKELDGKKPVFRHLARRIEQRKRSGRLLDVGSGPGLLETVLDRSRWKVLGVDMAPFIGEFGRRELGTNVITGRFQDVALPESEYDVIVMKYVLDHLEDPLAALRRARRLISPDGTLVIADLINIRSFCARVFRDGHRLIHPMHFTYFSPRTIRAHLARAGFNVESIEFPFFRTPYFTARSTVELLRRLGKLAIARVSRSGEVIASPPCYGNMMDVWARPA